VVPGAWPRAHLADLAAFDLQHRAMRIVGRREASAKRLTEAIDGSASPRKPSVATDSRSSSEAILLVAWRDTASGSSSGAMPPPSSRMRIRRTPPSSRSMSTRRAPASSAFSTSSLTTDAGRSTTSPAAIWLMRMSGSWRIGAASGAKAPSETGFDDSRPGRVRRAAGTRLRAAAARAPPEAAAASACARAAYIVPGGGWRLK
jgi:hypothetical protein